MLPIRPLHRILRRVCLLSIFKVADWLGCADIAQDESQPIHPSMPDNVLPRGHETILLNYSLVAAADPSKRDSASMSVARCQKETDDGTDQLLLVGRYVKRREIGTERAAGLLSNGANCGKAP